MCVCVCVCVCVKCMLSRAVNVDMALGHILVMGLKAFQDEGVFLRAALRVFLTNTGDDALYSRRNGGEGWGSLTAHRNGKTPGISLGSWSRMFLCHCSSVFLWWMKIPLFNLLFISTVSAPEGGLTASCHWQPGLVIRNPCCPQGNGALWLFPAPVSVLNSRPPYSSSSVFPSCISGVHHFGWDFCVCDCF